MQNQDESGGELIKLLASWSSMASIILNSMGDAHLNHRKRASLALLQLCREHTKSISILMVSGDGNVTGSCLALLRPTFDALLRGWWCGTCLSDEEFSRKWSTEKLFEKKARMLNEVLASSHPSMSLAFEKYSKSVQSDYHDFTHGGMVQVQRRFGPGGEIGAPILPVETCYIAHTALVLDMHAAELIAEVMGKLEYVEVLRDLQDKLGISEDSSI